MAKVGLTVRIDVMKLDKSRFYKGAKGTYLDLTTFVDLDQKDQYDNNGFITQSQSKEERNAGGGQMPILGNVRVFYTDGQNNGSQNSQARNGQWDNSGHSVGQNQQAGPDYGSNNNGYLDDDIPFS